METQDNSPAKRRKITPCKDCTDRHRACWGHCEAYQEWRAEKIAENKRIAKARGQEKAVMRTLYGYRGTARFRHLQEHRRFK